MSKKKEKHGHKTNAIRMVEAEGIPYKMYTYDAPDGFLDGVSVAKSLGQDLDRVFKTLVTEGSSREHYVCVIPVAEELDLKKAAKHFGEKKVEMIHVKDMLAVTGYIRGGCSPIGMKKHYPIYIEEMAQLHDTVMVSAGQRGIQVTLEPEALRAYVEGIFVSLV